MLYSKMRIFVNDFARCEVGSVSGIENLLPLLLGQEKQKRVPFCLVANGCAICSIHYRVSKQMYRKILARRFEHSVLFLTKEIPKLSIQLSFLLPFQYARKALSNAKQNGINEFCDNVTVCAKVGVGSGRGCSTVEKSVE